MNYAELCKHNKTKLELSPFDGRCWRKFAKGKMYYFSCPLTAKGYQDALAEWSLLRSKLSTDRPHFEVYSYHLALFNSVIDYYTAFGVSKDEKKLKRQVEQFIELIEEQLKKPVLTPRIQTSEFLNTHPEFAVEFAALDDMDIVLPTKWQDRISRLKPTDHGKQSQTIAHWVERYLERVESKVGSKLTKESFGNRRTNLKAFKSYAALDDHITTIDNQYLHKFHKHVDSQPWSKPTKVTYFSVFRMFVRWCSNQTNCDLTTPSELDANEFGFRIADGEGRKRMNKQKLLWTQEEFDLAMTMPIPYKCFLLLMLNCGFRHVDISELRHTDIDWKNKRIVIQRHKLQQSENAPVVSYPLWDATLEAMRISMAEHPVYVFRNKAGSKVEQSIKVWWGENRDNYGLAGKRLDFLRKTGSTTVTEYGFSIGDSGSIDSMYLGETLTEVSKKHYSFTDGKPCAILDKAIQYLGSKFGLCEAPTKTIELTPEIIEALQKLGVTV